MALHARPQPGVVSMVRIGAAIAVAKESAVDDPVVVGALSVLDRRGGRDGKGDLRQDGWLEDALGPDQGDSGAFEVEAALEDGTRDRGVAEATALLAEKLERAQPDRCIEVGSHSPEYPASKLTSSPEILQELRRRGDARHQQVVARAGARDV